MTGARRLDGAGHRALLRDLVAAGGAWVTCAGDSMAPTIRRGDRVRVEPCEPGGPRAGDVVLFEAARGHVLHRVVLRVPGTGWFLHIGDAGSGDGPGLARISRIVGRARLPRRRPGLPQLWAGGLRLARAAMRRTRRTIDHGLDRRSRDHRDRDHR